MAELDADNLRILKERQTKRDRLAGARVGDFVRMADGSLRRFSGLSPTTLSTYDGHGRRHTSRPGYQLASGNPSFLLQEDGTTSFSAGNDFVEGLEIRDTGEQIAGEFWFFHHDKPAAAGDVRFMIPCRVYEQA
jgi:hypothetical protein